MAISKSQDSYVDLDEANQYFTNRLDSDSWETAPELHKEQALKTATRLLDDLLWVGVVISADQPLAFPRQGSYFDPRAGMSITLTSDIPARIQNATFELAFHLLTNSFVESESGSVTNIQVGNISLQNVKSPDLIPGVVKRIVKPLLLNNGVSHWWRAN